MSVFCVLVGWVLRDSLAVEPPNTTMILFLLLTGKEEIREIVSQKSLGLLPHRRIGTSKRLPSTREYERPSPLTSGCPIPLPIYSVLERKPLASLLLQDQSGVHGLSTAVCLACFWAAKFPLSFARRTTIISSSASHLFMVLWKER